MLFLNTVLAVLLIASPAKATSFPAASPAVTAVSVNQPASVLSEVTYSLSNRNSSSFVNTVFADNMLLTLAYMDGTVKKGDIIPWDEIRAPGEYSFVLAPHHTFAFHDQVLERYGGTVSVTTNAHFMADEGFRSDGWLTGDGVCHLASFMNVAAKEAGLTVEAPTNHNFAKIADISNEDGVAIYYVNGNNRVSSRQNLYITNPFDKSVQFVFVHENDSLTVRVEEIRV